MNMRACLGLAAALMVVFAASPAFAVYTGVRISGADQKEIGSMTITLPGHQPAPVQPSQSDNQRKLGAYFIDTSDAPKPDQPALLVWTDSMGHRHSASVRLGDDGVFAVDLAALDAAPSTAGSTPTGMAAGRTVQFEVIPFAGVAFLMGHGSATAGLDTAVLWPIRDVAQAGVSAGGQWIDSAIVGSTGGMQLGSSFMRTSAQINQANLDGVIVFPLGDWALGGHVGATIAGVNLSEVTGFCGTSSTPTASSGCNVFNRLHQHQTVVGPNLGAAIQRQFSDHLAFQAQYSWSQVRVEDVQLGSAFGPTTGSTTQPSGGLTIDENRLEFGFVIH